jgi:hypothetical protein
MDTVVRSSKSLLIAVSALLVGSLSLAMEPETLDQVTRATVF